jgi:hypothetical protein
MFEKQERSVRLEDSADFPECFDRIGNGTEGPRTDDGVKGSIVERKSLSTHPLEPNGKGNGLAPLCHSVWQELHGVHSMQT